MNVVTASLPQQAKGTYILVIKLNENKLLSPGKLPPTTFHKGLYFYVGRAKKGLSARLERHLRKNKKLFWHIDYLLQKAEIKEIWIKLGFFDECQIAAQIKNFFKESFFPSNKFGSSDCHCPSHLVYVPRKKVDLSSLRKELSFERISCYGNQV